jgi:hypothetical protein
VFEKPVPPTMLMRGLAPAPAWKRWLADQPPWLLPAAGLALVVLLVAGVILSRIPGRVEIAGGQLQLVTPTPATTQTGVPPVQATPTGTVSTLAPTATPRPTAQAALPPVVNRVDFMDDGKGRQWCEPDTVSAGRIVFWRGVGRWPTAEKARAAVGNSWPPITADGQSLVVKGLECSDVEWSTNGPDDPAPGWAFFASVEAQLAPGVYRLSSQWLQDLKTCTLTVTEPVSSPMADQARAFAEPFLKAIANRTPDLDDFSTADKGWRAQDYDGQGGDEVSIENGQLRILVGGTRDLTHVVNPAARFRNFVLAADVTAKSSSSRPYSPQMTWGVYTFVLLMHGNAWVTRPCGAHDCEPDYASGYDPDIADSKTMRMMVIARGSEFALYLNGKPLAYVKDSARLPAEGFTLAASSDDTKQATLITYDNVQVWNLDNVPGLP